MKYKKVKLGEVCTYQKKSSIKAGDGENNGIYPFFTSSTTQSKFLDSFQFEEEGLIFGTGGKASVHFCNTKFSVSTDCVVLKEKKPETVFLRYVYYVVLGNMDVLESGFKGAGLKHVSKDYISNLEIPLPDLPTQRHIAEVLDKADALRQQNRQLLALYDQLLQSTFIELFGDPVKNPKGWEVKRLGEVVEKIIGGGTPSREKDEYFTGDICWATSKDIKSRYLFDTQEHITEDAISQSATKLVDTGTILIVVKSKILMHTLPITITKVPVCFGQDLKGIIPKHSLNTIFAVNQIKINEKQLLSLARGVNTEGLTLPHLNNFPIILPPLPLQAHFAAIVAQIEVQKAQAGRSLAESEELFEGLLAGYFG